MGIWPVYSILMYTAGLWWFDVEATKDLGVKSTGSRSLAIWDCSIFTYWTFGSRLKTLDTVNMNREMKVRLILGYVFF